MSVEKFRKGDIVQVTSEFTQSYGMKGEVQGYTSNTYDKRYVKVYIYDTQLTNNYNENSLKLINKNMEEKVMVGNFDKVVGVNFLDGTNLTKEYYFALYDDVEIGGFVLCDTANGFRVGKVISIKTKDQIEIKNITKEVVCVVDMSGFETRKANRAKASKLKNMMDKRIQELQDVALFEMMSEKDDSLKSMLAEYKNLIG